MDPAVRDYVRQRARFCCEYCRLPERHAPVLPFHLEHIIPRQHGGTDDPNNLALSCHSCNLHKGPNLSGRASHTLRLVRLFHPRRHKWSYHFHWDGPILVGRTAIGRVTVQVLAMNDPDMVRIRESLSAEGIFPP
jgi:hypothetical protein